MAAGIKFAARAAAHAEADTIARWKKNALRHSDASYRLAECADAARVSLELGNTPQMVFRHYRELVKPAEAAKWFGIVPKAKK